jgi:hypothetical protein
MSFYETSNANIIRFAINNPAKKVVAPFRNIKRIAAISYVGAGTGAHYTGALTAGGNVNTFNNSFLLTPEQIQNGSLIINPTGTSSGIANPFSTYTLPSAFALQEYLSGRGAFNMISQNTGANDYFILNVYNLCNKTGVVKAFDNQSEKVIQPGTLAGGEKAALTPVLIQFSGVNSSYATVNSAQNYVSYTLY